MKFLRTFGQNQSGATAIEYGLIAALIAVAAITAMDSLGKKAADAADAGSTTNLADDK